MVICRDFWMSREGMDERFSLCSKCAQPQAQKHAIKYLAPNITNVSKTIEINGRRSSESFVCVFVH